MILASHNSWTYLPPKRWWMRPFSFIARCQDKSIVEQYEAGVRLFDLRVRYDKADFLVPAHGLMEYRLDALWECLSYLNEKKDCHVRVILETSRADTKQEVYFRHWCELQASFYKNITFIGGQRKFDWEKVYDFKTEEPAIKGCFASAPSDKWYGKLNDLWPWLWAIRHNKKVLEENKDYEGYLMMDFI